MRRASFFLLLIAYKLVTSLVIRSSVLRIQRFQTFVHSSTEQDSIPISIDQVNGSTRRQVLLSTSAAALTLLAFSDTASASDRYGLDDITLGHGRWTPQKEAFPKSDQNSGIPATFCTYASRFLIQYDEGVKSWWYDVQKSYSLLSDETRLAKSYKTFGCLARSLQLAVDRYLQEGDNISRYQQYENMANTFVEKYGNNNLEARRHLALLFTMLPRDDQPILILQQLTAEISTRTAFLPLINPEVQMKDLTSLLPTEFRAIRVNDTYVISPPLSLYEVGVEEEFGTTTVTTMAGPLAANPLKREQPQLSTAMYGLFGISGATACALTHMAVIPLDVVKTRMQTDPGHASSMYDAATTIIERDGFEGLFLGMQATIAAYLWYGMSVYPSYTFFKRFLAHSLSSELAAIHTNEIALLAGAMSAVIASIGVTPMEACRIRTVAQPTIYQPKGLLGTIQAIATEDSQRGWTKLYVGLPPLVTRQVIFGSIKFLAFEQACEILYRSWPVLHDATWTALGVSLVAGAFAGCLSSVMSQPADSILTYVSQNRGTGQSSLGVLEGSRIMIQQGGVGSLFRGLGSRCVWAGSIIGGQFLLYDIFRTFFGVNGEDLAQIYEVVIETVAVQ